MILAFILIISMGPIPIVILIFAIQLLVFREVISVAHQKSVERRREKQNSSTASSVLAVSGVKIGLLILKILL